MTDLEDLIERLEAAMKGSRELDQAIVDYLYTKLHDEEFALAACEDRGNEFGPRPLTTSLDAALALVPEGWDVQLFIKAKGSKARLKRLRPYTLIAPMEGYMGKDRLVATPALALCIAALKARDTDD